MQSNIQELKFSLQQRRVLHRPSTLYLTSQITPLEIGSNTSTSQPTSRRGQNNSVGHARVGYQGLTEQEQLKEHPQTFQNTQLSSLQPSSPINASFPQTCISRNRKVIVMRRNQHSASVTTDYMKETNQIGNCQLRPIIIQGLESGSQPLGNGDFAESTHSSQRQTFYDIRQLFKEDRALGRKIEMILPIQVPVSIVRQSRYRPATQPTRGFTNAFSPVQVECDTKQTSSTAVKQQEDKKLQEKEIIFDDIRKKIVYNISKKLSEDDTTFHIHNKQTVEKVRSKTSVVQTLRRHETHPVVALPLNRDNFFYKRFSLKLYQNEGISPINHKLPSHSQSISFTPRHSTKLKTPSLIIKREQFANQFQHQNMDKRSSSMIPHFENPVDFQFLSPIDSSNVITHCEQLVATFVCRAIKQDIAWGVKDSRIELVYPQKTLADYNFCEKDIH